MFDLEIHRVFLGNSNAFVVISGCEAMVIDGGLGNRVEKLTSLIRNAGGSDCRLKYIAVTHAHYDHVGSVTALKQAFPEARVIAQTLEAENLRQGRSPVPAGTMWFSRPLSWLGCQIFHHCIRFKGFAADIAFNDKYLGVLNGHEVEFFHTPGHTAGSMCVRVDRRAVFVGDTVFHLLPSCFYPPFADDEALVSDSWKKILGTSARMVYPGHGRPFPLKKLAAAMPAS